MTGFVDATDEGAVREVLAQALPVVGLEGLIAQLDGLPGLEVSLGRPRGLLRPAVPATVGEGDRVLVADLNRAVLQHVVGGVVLARDPVPTAEVPGVLAALVVRAVRATAAGDHISVRLTALRDAVQIA